MKEYDYLIVGGGIAGLTVLFSALSQNARVALVEKGPLGGTCQNVGCVPSKMLIYPADVITSIQGAGRLGIEAGISSIDFGSIMGRTLKYIAAIRKRLERNIKGSKNLDYYHAYGYFVDRYTMEVGGERIRGKKIFIASGSRNEIPAVKGLDAVDYLTNESLLGLRERPESMVIIGGGYIAAEYGHFFASVGARVIILQNADRLVPHEEPEISDLLKKELEKRMEVHTGIQVTGAKKEGKVCIVTGKSGKAGRGKKFPAGSVLVAAGRKSNADMLKAENTGIETDERNYIKVDEHLETSARNIWAVGDAVDKLMFTHSGDREAEIAWHNASGGGKKRKMDFSSVPHAVYTHPQIASVGMTEARARQDHEVLTGVARYSDIVMGDAMREEAGFAKAVVEKGTGRILGFHIIGPHAALLIQEVTNAMAQGRGIDDIKAGMHIFPSLSELVPEALGNLKETREHAFA